MGVYTEINLGSCPKCGGDKVSWQSKRLWLTYKYLKLFIGDLLCSVKELDENMNGEITAYCAPEQIGGCAGRTLFDIRKGKLIPTEHCKKCDGAGIIRDNDYLGNSIHLGIDVCSNCNGRGGISKVPPITQW